MFTPTRARSAAIAAATPAVSSTSSTAPSARLPGYELPRAAEPCHVAALLVERDEDLPGRAEAGGQRGELRLVADVVREEGDPAEAAFEPAEHPVGRLVAGEARQQAAGASRSTLTT